MAVKYPSVVLLGGLFLVALVVVHSLRQKQRPVIKGNIARLSDVKKLPRYKYLVLQQKVLNIFRWLSLGVLSIALLILAARPTSTQTNTNTPLGLDVMIVLDTSGSMTNYFHSVGASINNMVSQFKTDRLGLIVFSGEAQQVLPLTDDYTEIKSVADYMVAKSPEDFRYHYAYGVAAGTDISSGLYLAGAKMANEPKERSKVVVLISDGEQSSSSKDKPGGNVHDNTQIVQSGAAALARHGIRMYAIAVPGEGYGIGSFSSGKALLQNVSAQTGGTVYNAADPTAVGQVFSQINKLLRQEIDGNLVTTVYETPWPWLIIALGALLLLLIISSQRYDGGIA